MSGIQCASTTVYPTSACDDPCIALTPVVMRKRKADDDPLPFSTGKKLVIFSSVISLLFELNYIIDEIPEVVDSVVLMS